MAQVGVGHDSGSSFSLNLDSIATVPTSQQVEGRIGSASDSSSHPLSPLRGNSGHGGSSSSHDSMGMMGSDEKNGSLPSQLETLDEPVSTTIVSLIMCMGVVIVIAST
jgi:hypothetical protein